MKRKNNLVHRLRISLLSGPWTDGEECVRYIDFPATACLYDLHEAIQDAIEFDNEHPFYFFQAEADGSDREMLPAEIGPEPTRSSVDCDVYENLNALENIPDGNSRCLFYDYMSDGGDWIFQIESTGENGIPAGPISDYPMAVESLSSGPNPTQYGHDFDDYAEEEDAFQPRRRNETEAWDDAGEGLVFDESEDDPFGRDDYGDEDPNW